MTDALREAIERLEKWLSGNHDIHYASHIDGDVRLVLEAVKELDFEEEAGDLHRNLNRRTAEALGKPASGENSSWHDIPEQVAALVAELAEIKADDVLVNEFHATVLEKLEAELDEWRGHNGLLTVHGLTPPKPRT